MPEPTIATPSDLRTAVRGDWRADTDPASDTFAGRCVRICNLADLLERLENDEDLKEAVADALHGPDAVGYAVMLAHALTSLVPSLSSLQRQEKAT